MGQEQGEGPDRVTDDIPSSRTHRPEDAITRRRFLKLLGVGTIGASMAAGAGHVIGRQYLSRRTGPTGHATTDVPSFDTVLNAVEDLGMDNSGDSPVNSAIQQAAQQNALVEMPPGEYLVTPTARITTGSVGFRGLGESRRDARFTVAAGTAERYTFDLKSGGEFLFQNVSLDQKRQWDRQIGTRVAQGSTLVHLQTELLGTDPNPTIIGDSDPNTNVFFPTRGATMVLDDFRKVGPADIRQYPMGRNVVLGGIDSDITIRNSDIRNTTNGSALYLNNCTGDVLVDNNYFENCVHSAVRVNGSNATVRNNTIVIDPFGKYGNPDNRWSHPNFQNDQQPMRGIWCFDPVGRSSGKPRLENNEIYHGTGNMIGCIVLAGRGHGAIIRDSRVYSSGGGPLVNASPGATAEITGSAFSGKGSLNGPGSLRDCCVGPDITIRNFSTENINRSDSCEQPGGCPSPDIYSSGGKE